MILSNVVTIGQITFILRVAIQILSYGGLAMIGYIILANAPRLGTADTHDVLNRVIGSSSANTSSMKWIFNRVRGRKDPLPASNLLLALFLFISYAAFVALSDIGFLGFYACSVPGPTTFDAPASISSDDAARALVAYNMINGSDPSKVRAYRCDSVTTLNFGPNVTENQCNSWRNFTYADSNIFSGINSTDSDILMPRQLQHHVVPKATIDLNSFYMGPDSQRVVTPVIKKGVAVEPHDGGLRVVFGVPEMGSSRQVDLDKTLAVELEAGCMTLGIYTQHVVDAAGIGIDLFDTRDTWRKYTGPDYLRNALAKAADDARAYYRPFFNESSLGSTGLMSSINDTHTILSAARNVQSFLLPKMTFSDPDATTPILGNCTEALSNQLNLTYDSPSPKGSTCTFLQVGGSLSVDGILAKVSNKMICASATQVNMVAATIITDDQGVASVNLTRLPSDLHYMHADYWDVSPRGNDTIYMNFIPYERFTLSDNPSGPTSHFIAPTEALITDNSLGPGSGGNVIKRLGDAVTGSDMALSMGVEYAGLSLLEGGFSDVDLNTTVVTRWMGEFGASYILTSVGYNGWAARESNQLIKVLSTGGRVGSCYKPQYALGFLPLILAASVVICWSLALLFSSSLLGSTPLKDAYGGLTPLMRAVAPGAPESETLLVWEKQPQPRLDLVSKGHIVSSDAPSSALKFLKSAHSYS